MSEGGIETGRRVGCGTGPVVALGRADSGIGGGGGRRLPGNCFSDNSS